jgi:hypothetical protein
MAARSGLCPWGDITYIPTSEGWLYLAVILDLFTRKVVGWAMREHMRAELTIAALVMAIQRRRPGAGLIHHSDRASQYAAGEYRDILQAATITQSMSRKANCWGNAPMESFFGTLKTELVHHRNCPDRDTARRDLFAISKAITIVRGSTPPSATSPHSRRRQKPHNPVSTFPGEGHVPGPPISTTQSTPRPSVSSRTFSSQSGVSVQLIASEAPNAFSRSALSAVEVVAITRAPKRRANCSANTETPPEPPGHSSLLLKPAPLCP